MYVDTFKPLSTLSLCFGIGGLDHGLARGIAALRHPRGYKNEEEWRACCEAVLRYAAYVEIESVGAYNLVAKMEQGRLAPAPVWSDLKTFPYEDFYGKIHCLTGGYPCQPFSQAGLQAGTSDPRHLFPYIEHGIDATRPVFCWFENVANHLNIGYREVRSRISRLGYKVEADIFAAEQVGAPHLRKRLFILAVADTYCNESSKKRGDLAEMLGLQEEPQPKFSSALPRGDGEKALAGCDGLPGRGESQFKVSGGGQSWDELEGGNGVMGDADNQRQQQRSWLVGEGGRRVVDSGEAMDNTFLSRLEGHRRHGNAKTRWENEVRSVASSSLFPAGQGRYQHGWEEPRLESSVGFTVDGYDFTEDLLRMAGNAVVEQQAELAFRTLIQKFL
jgi:DNA (cytosine-5)-methyltransferase 1